MAKRRSYSRRRLVIGSMLALFLVGLAAGGYWVYRRGTQRANLYDRAAALMRAKDLQGAERVLKDVLEADTADLRARSMLIDLYRDQGRVSDAEQVARDWLSLGRETVAATAHLSELALMQGRLQEAERLARTIADQAPEFALRAIVRIQDAQDTPASRWAAHRMAVNLAALSERPERRAHMLLYAGGTLLDLLPDLQPASVDVVRERAHQYLGEALGALERARELGFSDSDAVRLSSLIRLRSKEEWQRRDAAKALIDLRAAGQADTTELLALASYHMDEAQWADAVRILDGLDGAPLVEWFRALRRLLSLGRPGDVLALLPDALVPDHPVILLVKANALLDSSPELKRQGVEVLTNLLATQGVEDVYLVKAYNLLTAKGMSEDAARFLEGIKQASSDARVQALALQRQMDPDAPSTEPLQLRRIARAVQDFREGVEVLRILSQSGREAALDYLEEQIRLGGTNEPRFRLLRAVLLARLDAAAQEPGAGRAYREIAMEDLRALTRLQVQKSDRAVAWPLALQLEAPELAGELCGLAIGQEGEPANLASIVAVMGVNTTNPEVRARVADGLVQAVGSGGDRAPVLMLLAEELRQDRPTTDSLRQRVAALPQAERETQVALLLALDLALTAKDSAAAEALALQLHKMDPKSGYVRLQLLHLRLLRGAVDEALAVEVSPDQDIFEVVRLRATALLRKERRADALALLRGYLAAHPEDARGHEGLAELQVLDGHLERALAVLAIAPPTREILLRQAQYLTQHGDEALAEQALLSVVARWPEERTAWRMLSAILTKEKRGTELINFLTKSVERSDVVAAPEVLSEVLTVRGTAYEGALQYERALADYRRAIELDAKNFPARNNAAWLVVSEGLGELAEASTWIEDALRLSDDHPQVLHTAHRISAQTGNKSLALERLDRAIKGRRTAAYLLDRATLLRELERNKEAEEQLEALIREFSAVATDRQDAKTLTEAERLLRQWRAP